MLFLYTNEEWYYLVGWPIWIAWLIYSPILTSKICKKISGDDEFKWHDSFWGVAIGMIIIVGVGGLILLFLCKVFQLI